MGFDVLQTTLLGIPSDFIQGISLVAAGYVASQFPNRRIIVMTVANIACIIASACMAYLPLQNNWGRLVAFWFTSLQRSAFSARITLFPWRYFSSVGFSLGLSMVSINIGGCKWINGSWETLSILMTIHQDTKKAFTVSVCHSQTFIFYNWAT